ncbi:retrotransposon protein, putative, ty1-copia subclass [Tanacetum coccineum]
MFEKEKLSGNNFNDWFARLKLVLRVDKKMHVIEQPLPPAPKAGAEPNIVAQWTALYDAHTELLDFMLGENRFNAQGKNKGNQGKGTRKVYIPKPSNQKSAANEPQLKDMPATTVRSNKRVKHNLDSTYLWHCRLAHINKKRIKQLQQDGLLKSTDDESFDKCESCLSGKEDKEPSLIVARVEAVTIHFIYIAINFPITVQHVYLSTRPDVAFAQNLTSRFQQNPGELHWTAVKNILKYLRNTKDMFLVYGGNPSTELRVECYCDAGFETDRDDTKSQTGYVFVLNGGAVDWKSSKQSTIAMSATESEYIAASEAAIEAVWIRKFISGLGIVPTINEPLNMYCDNSAAIHYANEPGVQKGVRHYHRRYHYVRECVELGEIRILKVHTDNNLVDPFTKALSNRKLTQHARSMGLRPASSFM